MEPVLKAHFNNFKKAFEINSPEGDGAMESNTFEKFVNYVLFSLDYPGIFTADLDLLDFVCVGGGFDTGIDGVGIRINDRLVRNVDEVIEITAQSKKINIEFVFIQTKMRPSFDLSELNTFGMGVRNFFSTGYLPANSKISELREIKDFIYNDQAVISKLVQNPQLYLYYVGTGVVPTDDNFTGMSKWLVDEFTNNFYFEKVDIRLVGGKQLIKFCRELENKFEVQMNVIDIFPLTIETDTSLGNVKKAYAFTCSASELLKILEKEDGLLRRSLFNDNVRDYLGNKGAVNHEIEHTILEEPEMFLLCNNGITIVCSDFEQVRGKLVKIENPQVVNGCQTSNSIFNYKDTPNVNKVQILVKLISTEDLAVSNKIVRGTNKQNQVLEEAFEATLPFHQETLEPFFLAFDNDIKIYYERRAKQYNNDPLIKKTQIVNLRILTQTFVAMFLNAPHESHRHEAKLLDEYAKDTSGRKIFDESHSAYPYYICAATWYMFEKYFREELIDKKYKPYKAQLYLIFRISVGEFPPRLVNSRALDAYCDKLKDLLSESQFKIQLKAVLEAFDSIQTEWVQQDKSRYGIKDNKEFTELLTKRSREIFISSKPLPYTERLPVSQKAPDGGKTIYEGAVLSIMLKEDGWCGYIKRNDQLENVYFDQRGYKGALKDLVPKTKVRFEIMHKKSRQFALRVEPIK